MKKLAYFAIAWIVLQMVIAGTLAIEENNAVVLGTSCESKVTSPWVGVFFPIVVAFAHDQERWLDYCRARNWK